MKRIKGSDWEMESRVGLWDIPIVKRLEWMVHDMQDHSFGEICTAIHQYCSKYKMKPKCELWADGSTFKVVTVSVNKPRIKLQRKCDSSS